MQDTILEIIRKHGTHGFVPCAKELKDLIIQFIDWLAKEVTLKLVWHDNTGYTKEWHYLPDKWNVKGTTGKCWSLDELFQHWYNEISDLKLREDPNKKYQCTCDLGQSNWRDCPLHGGH